MIKAIRGAINQISQNCLTTFLEKVSFQPNFETLNARMAKVFSWTSEVGIPLVTEATNKSEAVTNEIIDASTFPIVRISVPVLTISLCPKMELPMAKAGAMIKVERIMISRKLLLVGLMCNSLVIMEVMGPAALATLLDPIENAT